jgi:hypothetical protein
MHWHPLLVIEGCEDNIAPNPEPAHRFEPDRREAIYLFFDHGLPGRSRYGPARWS